MLTILFSLICLTVETPFSESLAKRTEAEWICTRCRRPAEGCYCIRCGQVYEAPAK